MSTLILMITCPHTTGIVKQNFPQIEDYCPSIMLYSTPAPDSLLNCVNWVKCKTGCKTQHCSCKKANLSCTEHALVVSVQTRLTEVGKEPLTKSWKH